MTKLRTAVPGAVQAVGAVGALAGLWLLAGLAWVLLTAGVSLLAVGVLVERSR